MGAQESKDNIPNTPETPHFAAYAKLFSLTEDPRSPAAGEGRTPMLVQKKIADPRSPTFVDDAGRTPIYSIPEPVSPFVRYKMENPAFQDSPLSGYMTEKSDTSDSISKKLENMELEAEEINQISTHVDAHDKDMNEVEKPKLKKRQQRKSSSKSLLKTALFKSYIDDENFITNEQVEVTPNKTDRSKENTNDIPKRTPLASKNNFVLFTNENTSSAKKFEEMHHNETQNDLQRAKRKLTLRELSIACDKENVQF